MSDVQSLESTLSLAAGNALRRRVGRDHDGFQLNPDYCRQVARWYDQAPLDGAGRRGRNLYDRFKAETVMQYESVLAAGITVRPWLGEGQPYATSHELRARVPEERTLYVYLTEHGHGPVAGDAGSGHPMLAPSAHVVDGVTLTYNDLFRAVHDLFGHVMHANTFRIEGELRAVESHLAMYSPEVAPVVLAETAGQICWFYFGPESGAVEKPYPPQKVLVMPGRLVRGFWRLFDAPAGAHALGGFSIGNVVFA